MPEPEQEAQDAPSLTREVSTLLPRVPEGLIIGSQSQAFIQDFFNGKEITEEDDRPSRDEYQKHGDLLQERELPVQYYRGAFLDRFFALDHNLGIVLAEHFAVAQEKWDEWEHWMLGGVSFSQKIQLIQRLIDRRGLASQFPGLTEHLQQMNRFRNVLAHGGLQPLGEDVSRVTFSYFQRGVFKKQTFRHSELFMNVLRVSALNWTIDRLHMLVAEKEREEELEENGGEGWDVETIRKIEESLLDTVRTFYTVQPGTCPECGTEGAALQFEPAADAWTEPDYSGQDPVWVGCTNTECNRYEPEYDALMDDRDSSNHA